WPWRPCPGQESRKRAHPPPASCRDSGHATTTGAECAATRPPRQWRGPHSSDLAEWRPFPSSLPQGPRRSTAPSLTSASYRIQSPTPAGASSENANPPRGPLLVPTRQIAALVGYLSALAPLDELERELDELLVVLPGLLARFPRL